MLGIISGLKRSTEGGIGKIYLGLLGSNLYSTPFTSRDIINNTIITQGVNIFHSFVFTTYTSFTLCCYQIHFGVDIAMLA